MLILLFSLITADVGSSAKRGFAEGFALLKGQCWRFTACVYHQAELLAEPRWSRPGQWVRAPVPRADPPGTKVRGTHAGKALHLLVGTRRKIPKPSQICISSQPTGQIFTRGMITPPPHKTVTTASHEKTSQSLRDPTRLKVTPGKVKHRNLPASVSTDCDSHSAALYKHKHKPMCSKSFISVIELSQKKPSNI